MIWQRGVHVIALTAKFTNKDLNSKDVFEHYWPADVGRIMQIDKYIQVTNVKIDRQNEGFTITELTVTNKKVTLKIFG